jgi:hypothetical protein
VGEDAREEAHAPQVAVGELVALHRVEELHDADDPPLGDQRHGQDGAGLEDRRVAAPARIGGHVVHHLGDARPGDAADDPLPHRHAQVADRARGLAAHYPEEQLLALLVQLPDGAGLRAADRLGILQGTLEHRLDVQRAGETATDLEKVLVLPEPADQIGEGVAAGLHGRSLGNHGVPS